MTAHLVVCTPTMSGNYLSAWTHASLLGLRYLASSSSLRATESFDYEISDTWLWPYDLARVRSRAVRKFLALPPEEASHLLFVDSDIAFDPRAIPAMLGMGKDVISIPYPKRDIRWDLAYEAAREGEHPEVGAYEYVYRALEMPTLKGKLIKVTGVGMGCTLLSRRCLDRMARLYGVAHAEDYPKGREDLRAWDNHPDAGMGGETIMLFAMQWGDMNGKRHLFGEDLSFCNRWKAIGGDCFLYLGAGAPASHVGAHYYRGTPDGFARDAARGDKGREQKQLTGVSTVRRQNHEP